jgi:phage terminase large subunit
MDFGYTNDPTAIVTVGVDGNNLYIDEVAYNTQMLSSDIIRTLKAQEEQLEVIAESADPRLIQEIYRAGINIHPVKKFGGSVDAGIQKMLQYTLHITKRSTNVIKEQKNYTYRQDKEGKWLNEPIDAYNHAMDAVRYVVMAKLLGGERKPLDKAAIRRVVY